MSVKTDAPSPTKFAHAVLRSGQPDALAAFWCELLNGRIVFQQGPITFITYDDEHHRLAIAAVPGAQPSSASTSGLDHLAYTYKSLEDLAATYYRLAGAGIEPAWCINHGPTLSMYYQDPDGNKAELQIDLFDSMEESIAWMRSPEFAENPIGIRFDPEKLFADFEAGIPKEHLTQRRKLEPGESPMEHLPA